MRAKEVSTANEKPLRPPQSEFLKNQIATEKQERLLKEWLEAIKRSSKIQVEESLLQG
jgi:hypothetical protein